MHCPASVLATLILVGAARADDSDKPWQIHGQVIDEQGKPVEDFEAATFWLSNGNWWDEQGELLKEAAAGKFWTNEGVLAPSPHIAQSGFRKENSHLPSTDTQGLLSSRSTSAMNVAALSRSIRARPTDPSQLRLRR